MSMWKRLSRAVSSNLERFRDDPLGTIKLDIAAFSADLETLRQELDYLEADLQGLTREERELTEEIREALKAGDRDRGLDLAHRLSGVRGEKAKIEQRLESIRRGVRRAEGIQRKLKDQDEAQGPRATPPKRQPAPQGPPLPSPTAERDPVIVVKARETLDRLERELSSQAQPAPRSTPPARSPEPRSPEAKTLGGGGELSDDPRPQATKTLGGASVAFQEPQTPPSSTESAKTIGSAIGSAIGSPPASPPVLKVQAKERASSPQPAEVAAQSDLDRDLDLVDELERLAKLRESGALSEEEFKVAKAKLIDPA